MVGSAGATAVYGIALAGWSSNNKYASIGGLRAAAQVISYELALSLSLVAVVLMAGSASMNVIIEKPYDRYISEKWFIRNSLNLEAEGLAQLKAALSAGEFDWYEEGTASLSAREDYSRERLRLLYVGITRAKKDLIVTWNSGRKGDATPNLALSELMGWDES